jgi:hypothetical protein
VGVCGTGFQDSLLSGAERDDAADRIIRRDAYGDAIAGHDLDPEAAHPAAQLREDLMTRVTLDAVEAARMNGDDGPLHVDQIVFAQQFIPFTLKQSVCHSAG